VYFLTRAGVEANARFLADFVGELIRQRAPLDAIWAYEPWEEAYLLADAAPFTWTSGSFTSANGKPKPTRNEKPVQPGARPGGLRPPPGREETPGLQANTQQGLGPSKLATGARAP
jgi:hypothetical protein